MNAELIALRVVHILGALLWAGTSISMALFLGPAMASLGPAAGPVMGALVKRRQFTIIPIVAVITMLAGVRLLQLASMGFSAAYFATRSGQTYIVGAVCALTAFTVFMAVGHPAIGQTMKLAQQMAQAPESERGAIATQMAASRARGGKASAAAALFLTIAAVAMAVGRYM